MKLASITKQQTSRLCTAVCVALLTIPVVSLAQIRYTVDSPIKPESIEELLVAILEVFIVIATPIVVFFIMYAGFLYVTARGDVQQTQQATRALTYAVIGGLLILGAVVITGIVSDTVGEFLVKKP